MVKNSTKAPKITNPAKAIRAKCVDCCCNSIREVELCTVSGCPLYPFRFGKNPYRKAREFTPEQLEALKARLTRNSPINTGGKTHNAPAEGKHTTHIENHAERTTDGESAPKQ